MTHPPLLRLTLYTRKMEEMAAFYATHFGYTALAAPGDRLVELRPPGPGVILNLHPLAKSQKAGQALVKLCFEVPDVAAFATQAAANGLTFGKPFKGDGYVFANAKDPAGNSISITSRGSASLRLEAWNGSDA
ncbi:VOC family protein [Tateyamaria sp. SN6-1]|uniref:VOC family protein n=1 Tax=Tateyamaria sp. SN6-1 TaxID=3092148 RepID=UPI0039F5E47E